MAFQVAGDLYDRFMGRHSRVLALVFAEFAGARPGMRVLDVGCGSGALAGVLVQRVGAESVAAADPSPQLVDACATRYPDADVRQATAEALPWPDSSFDAALAQLVVNFMADPVAGAREMARVVAAEGTVAACIWDYAGRMPMLRTFWDAAAALDPDAPDEARTMRVQTDRDLQRIWTEAGLAQVETQPLEVELVFESFDDYWEPFTYGVGPAGAYCASLDEERRAALREECRRRLDEPAGAFGLPARVWAVRGRVG